MTLIPPSDGQPGRQPDCSVLIPVYNNRDLTVACIETLLAGTEATPYEIVVVDNASTDGVTKWLEKRRGQLTLLVNPQNVGYARANNQAAQAARGRYLVLLNNDTVPEPNWLDALVQTAESDEAVGVVGAKLLYPETRLVQHAGVVFNRQKRVYHIYEKFPEDHPAVNKCRDFQAVTGACMLVKASLYRRLGGLDEQFRNGFEDVDFCLRVRQAGHRVVYQPRAVVLHYCGQSQGRHAFEIDNSLLLTRRWSGKIQPDHEDYYREDGFRVVQIKAPDGTTVDAIRPASVPDALERLRRARQTLQDGNLSEALKQYLELYQLGPHFTSVLLYIAEIYTRMGDHDRAALHLKRAQAIVPTVGTALKLAQNALKRQAYAEAAGHAETALQGAPEGDPAVAEAHALRGDVAVKTGDETGARAAYAAALQADPECLRALVGLGAVELSAGHHRAAAERFSRALSLNPHHVRALLGKGLACLGTGDAAEAENMLRQAMLVDPDNSRALTALLPLLSQSGRLDEAYRLLDLYLRRYPDDPSMILAQAGVAFALGRYDDSALRLKVLKGMGADLPGMTDLEGALAQIQAAPATSAAAPV